MRVISRSTYDTFRECPRKGYWRYLSGPFTPDGEEVASTTIEGTHVVSGLEDPKPSVHLSLGSAWHLAAEGLLQGETGSKAATRAIAFAAQNGLGDAEQNWLLAASLAWERAVAEEFFSRWEVVSIEEELLTPLTSNVTLYTRADAILRDRGEGSLWVLNWKTAGDVKGWNRKWFYDIQSWTESLAAESKLGEPVRGCIYYGVWKGPMWNGNISSRLVYGYKHTSKMGSVTYGTENGGGGTRFSAWNEKFPFGEGVAAWINWLPKEFLARHFVESAPQIRQDELVEAWLRQVVTHESDVDHIIQEGSAQDKLDFFWQNWGEHCGRCAFAPLCTLKSDPKSLIKETALIPRRASPRDSIERQLNEVAPSGTTSSDV